MIQTSRGFDETRQTGKIRGGSKSEPESNTQQEPAPSTMPLYSRRPSYVLFSLNYISTRATLSPWSLCGNLNRLHRRQHDSDISNVEQESPTISGYHCLLPCFFLHLASEWDLEIPKGEVGCVQSKLIAQMPNGGGSLAQNVVEQSMRIRFVRTFQRQ